VSAPPLNEAVKLGETGVLPNVRDVELSKEFCWARGRTHEATKQAGLRFNEAHLKENALMPYCRRWRGADASGGATG
jgi:hypothetical protein